MATNRLDGLWRAAKELEAACVATLKAWSRHLWTEIQESVVDEDDQEAIKKFGAGYAFVRWVTIIVVGLFIGFGLLMLAIGIGMAMWQVIPRHQVEWLHTDSPLVRPLIVGAYTLVLVLWLGPSFQLSDLKKLTDQEKFALKNEARKTLAQICGGAILLTGLYASFRTLDISREGQLNELYSKSVEQIGATDTSGRPKLEVRIGGIYSLARIAEDSASLRLPAYNVLATYIRSRTPSKGTSAKPLPPSQDVQSAIDVLQGNQFINWPLWALDLRGYNFQDSSFRSADLSGSDLRGVDLVRADLTGANLSHADFRDAHLEGANVAGTDLRRTNLTQQQIDTLVGDEKTQIRSDLKRPSDWVTHAAGSKQSSRNPQDWIVEH